MGTKETLRGSLGCRCRKWPHRTWCLSTSSLACFLQKGTSWKTTSWIRMQKLSLRMGLISMHLVRNCFCARKPLHALCIPGARVPLMLILYSPYCLWLSPCYLPLLLLARFLHSGVISPAESFFLSTCLLFFFFLFSHCYPSRDFNLPW